ncbi:glycosyltransferase [Pseudolysinimonas kribbensis]|uniref:Glycosyl transferase family 1 n=1 Tax=Pseudolysinimonas kribbensis TaxID=433641 RepID=A0ABQ6K3S4_9MICO|nr:glycosyltransferase [Pseudolysinimonas kribbensis]GMA94612.1 glycosyl transferase family 1 [Pseudolysinimonas kribbensis]
MTGFSFLSTYPPTRCGLATFTEALAMAITRDGEPDARIVRMMDELAQPAVAAIRTRSRIVAELASVGAADESAIRAAARALSASDVAIVQHEYGIFGGEDGSDAVRVLELLTVPSIVVLHTVLDAPTAGQRAVLERVAGSASALVVMTAAALSRLREHYAIDLRKVSVIPHGVPAWAAAPREAGDHRSVLTWGLIGPGKGIEHGIRAIAALAGSEPDVRYIVSGQTHPKVVAHEGETYRESLHALVAELGLEDRVVLEDRYLDAAQLAARVGSADLVLLPYDSRTQVTSGVLVEAIAAGKPVVATAFPHAVELLGDGVGTVVPHEDPAAIADGVRAALGRLDSPNRSVAAAITGTSWADIAPRYRTLADDLIAHAAVLTA